MFAVSSHLLFSKFSGLLYTVNGKGGDLHGRATSDTTNKKE
jgi:hypothetical protein